MEKSRNFKRFFTLLLSTIFTITQLITVPVFAATGNDQNQNKLLEVTPSLVPNRESNTYEVGESFDINYKIKPKDIDKEKYDEWYKSKDKKKEIVLVMDTSGSMKCLVEPESYDIDNCVPTKEGHIVYIKDKSYLVNTTFLRGSRHKLFYITMGTTNYYIQGNKCYRQSSYNEKNRLKHAQESAIKFVKKFENDKNISIGLVSFDTRAIEQKELTSSLSEVKSSINNLKVAYNGATNIEAGLKSAQKILKKGNEDADKYVILMSDGFPTAFDYAGEKFEENFNEHEVQDNTFINFGYNDYRGYAMKHSINQADSLKKAGINSFIIGFSDGANSEKLNKIAKAAGGEYEEARNTDALNGAYNKIETKVKAPLIKNLQLEFNVQQGLAIEEFKNSITNETIQFMKKDNNAYYINLENMVYDSDKDNSNIYSCKNKDLNIKVKFRTLKEGKYSITSFINRQENNSKENLYTNSQDIIIIKDSLLELNQNICDKKDKGYNVGDEIKINYNIKLKPTEYLNETNNDNKKEEVNKKRKKRIVLAIDTSGSMDSKEASLSESQQQDDKCKGKLMYYFDIKTFKYKVFLYNDKTKGLWNRIFGDGFISQVMGKPLNFYFNTMIATPGYLQKINGRVFHLIKLCKGIFVPKILRGKFIDRTIDTLIDINENLISAPLNAFQKLMELLQHIFFGEDPIEISSVQLASGNFTINGKKYYVKDNKVYEFNEQDRSRIDSVKKVANDFVDKFKDDENTEIAIVRYSSKADVVLDNSNKVFLSSKDNETIKKRINSLKADGATNIGDGIRKSYSILDKCDKDSEKYMILMTDGVPTAYTCYANTIKTLNNCKYGEEELDLGYCPEGYIECYNRKYYYSEVKGDFKLENDNRDEGYVIKFGDEYDKNALEYAKQAMQKSKSKNINNVIVGFSDGIDTKKLKEIAGDNAQYKEAKDLGELSKQYDEIQKDINTIKAPCVSNLEFNLKLPKGLELVDDFSNNSNFKLQKSADNSSTIIGKINDVKYIKSQDGKTYIPERDNINFDIKVKIKENKDYVLGENNNKATLSYKDLYGVEYTEGFTPTINITMSKLDIEVDKFGILKSISDKDKENLDKDNDFIKNYIQDTDIKIMNNFMYQVGIVIKPCNKSDENDEGNIKEDIKIKNSFSTNNNVNIKLINENSPNGVFLYELNGNDLERISNDKISVNKGEITIKGGTLKKGQQYIVTQGILFKNIESNTVLKDDIEINGDKTSKQITINKTDNLPNLD
ncbi:vWA domain-containing protein [Clostridium novyi]|uniref:vWA domain-containing protein n=1 Tax=Clostridium novyi TaxID=1542 RepID=UPI000A500F08|nr:VWA domain-containing protein [Clostridium novyi]